MSDEMKRSYRVDIDLLSQHSYIVEEVNSPEEAEDAAKEWLDDGEEGEVSNQEIFSVDAYPIDSEEDETN